MAPRAIAFRVGLVLLAWLAVIPAVARATNPPSRSGASRTPKGTGTSTSGYYLAGADGGVFAFGSAPFAGSLVGPHGAHAPVVSIATPVFGSGYYLTDANGDVYTFGGAPFFGSLGGVALRAPIVAMVSENAGCVTSEPPPGSCPESDDGYYLVGADGGVFTFGAAPFLGSLGDRHLQAPIVGMALLYPPECGAVIYAVCAPEGYYLIGADGGVFTFGVPFDGSLAGSPVRASVVGASAGFAQLPTGGAAPTYTLVDAEGRLFTFGAGGQSGTADPLTGLRLDAPVVGVMQGGSDLIGADGGVFTVGGGAFSGSLSGRPLNAPIVGGSISNYFAS